VNAVSQDRRHHGATTAHATALEWNGYLLTVACPCGVVFERWVTSLDAEDDLITRSPPFLCGDTRTAQERRGERGQAASHSYAQEMVRLGRGANEAVYAFPHGLIPTAQWRGYAINAVPSASARAAAVHHSSISSGLSVERFWC
jgi:hypothetical protein